VPRARSTGRQRVAARRPPHDRWRRLPRNDPRASGKVVIIQEDIDTDVEVTICEQPSRWAHRFRLIVVDDSGNKSQPDELDVIVADLQAPTAVLTAPGTVPFGASFPLDGRRSVDAGGGQIVRYVWTYLGPSVR
jgi:hypothetical protein